MEKKVSFITVNYNQSQVTEELLESLEKVTYRNIEVIVVDNGSTSDISPLTAEKFPDVKFVKSHSNLGFAGGNNLGIDKATGDYLFFINNDTETTENILQPLIKRLESSPDIGAVCPKIMYFDNPDMIQFAGYTRLNPFTCRNYAIGDKELDTGQYDLFKETPYAHGAAMMLKKEVIEKAGVMPENFFLYYEELDWSEKIRKAGYKIVYEPDSVIYHKESVSTGKFSSFKTYYLTRNRILFCRRNFPVINLMAFMIWFILFSVPKNTFVYIVKGQFRHLNAFYSGILWNLGMKNNRIA